MSLPRTSRKACRSLTRLLRDRSWLPARLQAQTYKTGEACQLARVFANFAANQGGQNAEYNASTMPITLSILGGLLAWNWCLDNNLLASQAHCEASHEDPMGDAREALEKMWRRVADHIKERDAKLPSLRPSQRPRKPEVSSYGSLMDFDFELRDGADLERVLADLSARLQPSRSSGIWDSIQRSLVIKSIEGPSVKRTTFSSPAWPDFKLEVNVEKSGLSDLGPNTQVWSKSWSSAAEAGQDLASEVDSLWSSFSQDIQEMHRAVQRLLAFPEPDKDPFSSARRSPHDCDADLPGAWGISSRAAGQEAAEKQQPRQLLPGDHVGDWRTVQQSPQADPSAAAIGKLRSLGALVYPPKDNAEFDWDILAGYEEQKQQIEDTLLLALQHPEVYEAIAAGTRLRPGSNRPRAVLFEGPPGCGKTTSARVIASQASVPLIYIPLEAIMSKWYGQSERTLADMFKAAEDLPGCLVFLDEIDSLATSRGSDMHEATRRLLGVLLRQLDGFKEQSKTVVIGATNRKQDLDPALLSRFDSAIGFGLPSDKCRHQILKQFAKHLDEQSIAAIVHLTGGMSGRDLRDLCESAERRWASKVTSRTPLLTNKVYHISKVFAWQVCTF
ncbi:hypothetical protein WJX84_012167 [Apatococcus fuscideae]|uniref:AAA+ ATPase domain-containing protein n=1 Tax=Apatococcus fuscideae TaxID=2026836 RepID=A0AAW1SPT2_9CHLO